MICLVFNLLCAVCLMHFQSVLRAFSKCATCILKCVVCISKCAACIFEVSCVHFQSVLCAFSMCAACIFKVWCVSGTTAWRHRCLLAPPLSSRETSFIQNASDDHHADEVAMGKYDHLTNWPSKLFAKSFHCRIKIRITMIVRMFNLKNCKTF